MDYVLVKDKSSEKFCGQGATLIKLEANESHYPILRDLGLECKRGDARFVVPHSIPQVLNLFSRYGYRVVCCAACGTSTYARMCWTLAKEVSPT
ncbi:hypothetical protein AAVH_27905 [Aphelenchoides avenae]|nr:hypothetical protein AAVH_27905 [Aphelenchus avenae]